MSWIDLSVTPHRKLPTPRAVSTSATAQSGSDASTNRSNRRGDEAPPDRRVATRNH